jgi:hypothetical protein
MEYEPRPEPVQLTGIHLNLDAQAIEFEDRHGTVGRLHFTGETVLYEGRPLLLLPSSNPLAPVEAPAPPLPDQPPTANRRSPTIHNSSSRDPRVRF